GMRTVEGDEPGALQRQVQHGVVAEADHRARTSHERPPIDAIDDAHRAVASPQEPDRVVLLRVDRGLPGGQSFIVRSREIPPPAAGVAPQKWPPSPALEAVEGAVHRLLRERPRGGHQRDARCGRESERPDHCGAKRDKAVPWMGSPRGGQATAARNGGWCEPGTTAGKRTPMKCGQRCAEWRTSVDGRKIQPGTRMHNAAGLSRYALADPQSHFFGSVLSRWNGTSSARRCTAVRHLFRGIEMVQTMNESESLAERANELYWSASMTVDDVVEELGISRSALYSSIDPMPAGIVCIDCNERMVYSNRTMRDRGMAVCPDCGRLSPVGG